MITPIGEWASSRGAPTRTIAALVLYTAASALLIGRQALADPRHVCACIGGGDPPSYMWALRWWPYSIAHGLNPLFSHVVWSPVGANVAAAALIPLPSILAWPLTALFGALPAYDVLTILSPAAAATAMYLLCERITSRRLPALAGGWVYGFSSYELSQLIGHANLMLIALLPLAVLVVLARFDRALGRRAFVAIATALIVAQLLTSTEVLATGCAFGALALALVWLTLPVATRPVLVEVTLETASAGVLAALIASPYLYEAVVRTRPSIMPGAGSTLVTDLAGLVVPTQVTLVRFASATAARLPGNVAEQGAYFGVPLMAAFLASLWERRHTPIVPLLGAVAALGLLFSFGSSLTIVGHHTLALPWRIVERLPIAQATVPDRIVLYAWFALAIAVALWLATTSRWRLARWAVVVLGVVLILPDGAGPLFSGRPDLPALFTGNAYRRSLRPGSVVLALPYGYHGYSMLWQGETDFAFRMPEGYLSGLVPARFLSDPVAARLLANPPLSVSAPALRAFLRRYRVATVVVDPLIAGSWPAELTGLGLKGVRTAGAIVYEVAFG